jgi:thiosulfate reductase cytochrome b subunit
VGRREVGRWVARQTFTHTHIPSTFLITFASLLASEMKFHEFIMYVGAACVCGRAKASEREKFD